MAIEQVDLWGHVQRHVWPVEDIPDAPPAGVRLIGLRTTVHVCVDEGWNEDRYRLRADQLIAGIEGAVAKGRDRRAARLRAAWLHQVHLSRRDHAFTTARERGLRLDPVGRGPLVAEATVHYRDRLPWHLTPLSRYGDERLPDRAAIVLDEWNDAGTWFDAVYMAEEPVSAGHFPVRSLIATISADGRTGDWFVLDRWAS